MTGQTFFDQVSEYAANAWRKRWHGLGVAALCCAVGWTGIAQLPDRYESSASVYADLETLLNPLMKGLAVQVDLARQIDFMRRTLLSRPNVEKIIIRSDLDHGVATAKAQEALVSRLAEKIRVESEGHNLFRIRYAHADPATARRVVQSVVSLFIENHLGARSSDMRAVDRFLERQIEHYARELDTSEARLANFKKDQMGYLRSGRGDYFSELASLRESLEGARAKRKQAESRVATLTGRLRDEPRFLERPAMSVAPDVIGPDSHIMVTILELQSILADLRARYTGQHPDVIVISRRLAEAQEQLAREAAMQSEQDASRTAEPSPSVAHDENPVHTQLQVLLAQAEAEVASLRSIEAGLETKVEKWQQLARTVPNVEAELMRLTRDYQIIKERYEALRQRQESAKMSAEIARGPKVDFRIVEPPRTPIAPSWPNRPLFIVIVLLAGLGAGLGAAVLTDRLDSRIHDASGLRDAFVLPVLQEIPLARPARSAATVRSVILFLASACLLPTAMAALILS